MGDGKQPMNYERFPERDQQAGCQHRRRAWQGVEQSEVGMGVCALGDLLVELGDGFQGHSQLPDERSHQ